MTNMLMGQVRLELNEATGDLTMSIVGDQKHFTEGSEYIKGDPNFLKVNRYRIE